MSNQNDSCFVRPSTEIAIPMILAQYVDVFHSLPNVTSCSNNECMVGITSNENNIAIDTVGRIFLQLNKLKFKLTKKLNKFNFIFCLSLLATLARRDAFRSNWTIGEFQVIYRYNSR